MKIVCLDLDDVLSYSIDAWVGYANMRANIVSQDLIELKSMLSFAQYKELKLQYRKSGMKAMLPIMDGAVEFTEKLKELGYTIIIMTARPIYDVPEVFRDTLTWLQKSGIKYDLLFGGSKDKHIKILKYFPAMEFMVEDNHVTANAVASQGYTVYLMNNEYNKSNVVKGVIRVNNLNEVLENEYKKSRSKIYQ